MFRICTLTSFISVNVVFQKVLVRGEFRPIKVAMLQSPLSPHNSSSHIRFSIRSYPEGNYTSILIFTLFLNYSFISDLQWCPYWLIQGLKYSEDFTVISCKLGRGSHMFILIVSCHISGRKCHIACINCPMVYGKSLSACHLSTLLLDRWFSILFQIGHFSSFLA